MATVYDVEQKLIEESGRIGPEIFNRTLNTSVWLNLVKQDKWPDEMGSIINVLTYERALPLDGSDNYKPQTWTAIAANTGGNSGTCAPAANPLDWGQGKRTYQLEQSAIESPDICVNDLRFAVHRKQQLSNIMSLLQENTRWVLQERFREEYTRMAERKIIVGGASGILGTSGGAAIGTSNLTWFPATAPTGQLTLGLLKRERMRLIRDGAGITPLDRENGAPIFGLICSSETSDALLKQDAEVRQDVRWSSRVNELLAPLGVERAFQGFYHLIDDFAPRWDFVPGAPGTWVRRYPYKGSAATAAGKKLDISPEYEAAAFEDTFIFHADVLRNLVPGTITSPGANMQFDPQMYRGDWKWLNIQDRQTNPDKTIGYFRGVFQMGSMPIRPEWGTVLRHCRNPIAVGAIAC